MAGVRAEALWKMFNPFSDTQMNPTDGVERLEVATSTVYFFRGEEFVAKRELIRTITEYQEAQAAYPDCTMWMKIGAPIPWRFYHKGEIFSHFRIPSASRPVPKALPMMELVGAL